MGLVVQKHVTIGQLIFGKKAMACLLFWPTYPTFPYMYKYLNKATGILKNPVQAQTLVVLLPKILFRFYVLLRFYRGAKH